MIQLDVTARQLEILTQSLDEAYHRGDHYDAAGCTVQEFDELWDKLLTTAREHSDDPSES